MMFFFVSKDIISIGFHAPISSEYMLIDLKTYVVGTFGKLKFRLTLLFVLKFKKKLYKTYLKMIINNIKYEIENKIKLKNIYVF